MSPDSITLVDWNFGDGASSSDNNPTHIYLTAGLHEIELVVQTNNGCSDTAEIPVDIYAVPIADFIPSEFCLGENTIFLDASTISAGSITSYEWNFGDGSSLDYTIGSTDHLYSSPTTYSTTLIVESGFGTCTDSITKTITIHPLPIANFSSEETLICNPDCVQFSDQSSASSPIVAWLWDFENGLLYNQQNPKPCFSHESSNTQYFDVELTITDSVGCTDQVLVSNYLAVEPSPEAYFSYYPGSLNTEYTTVDFNNESLNASTYEWSFGDGSGSSNTNPEHTFPELAGNYAVQLYAFSESGLCVDSVTRVITIEDVVLFYVPNVFTPDGNGFNESFQPVFYSGFDPYDFHMTIFNRWGEVIFESYDASRGWNGHYGNRGLVEDGTYIWQIQFKEARSDKKHLYNGHITVLK